MENKIVKAFGTEAATSPLKEMTITRRDITAKDIEIEILYCGVCHSDLHTARNDWGGTVYPSVPGHEIVGKITRVGKDVTKFNVGDIAGVGCLVDSCRTCNSCKEDLEQYCLTGFTGTYNGKDKHLGGHTFGGYSEKVVVDEHFVLKVPANLNLAAVAPLLCAGITTWSPLKHWNVKEGSKVAVVGLGETVNTYKLLRDDTTLNINENKLLGGIYFYQVYVNEKNVYSGKIVITK